MGSNDNSGKNSNGNDPWTGGNKQPGPPDLDELVKKLRSKIKNVYKNSGGGNLDDNPRKFASIGLILGVLVLLWAASGIFIVSPSDRAVILRFGKYVETVGPGPHWVARFIESEQVVNVSRVYTYSYESQMLTKDENIVSVSVAVQYKIADAKDYLFNVVNPRESLSQATASSLRQVIGDSTLDDILTSGREKVREKVREQLIGVLKLYNAGIVVSDIALMPAKAPDAVKAAFDDAIKAQEDQQRFIRQAQAYANKVVPIAQGQAKRLIQEANAYKERVELQAKGDIALYLAQLGVYERAPVVTRERLYLDTIESVLAQSSKILVDSSVASNLMYLPIDKFIQDSSASSPKESVKVDIPKPVSADNEMEKNAAGKTAKRSNRVSSDYPDRTDYLNQGDEE